ncbi:hypothetical protein O9Z70_12795 [Devosia sp. YIM 151766]|uniref:hypothetical protein n=1 Tax=Devosia sp. YIM 151766 TaxID=3017325 RepID=UPI00255C8AFA|nr:hypothetical protein [Devosia sp. YIM 151766]WIY52331.1 hypothetical protein O9Z70_12795 [Devosia sp. YIM 151766]
MSDKIVKFRRPEKPPEPPVRKPATPMPGRVPFAVLLGLALLIFFAQESGLLG